MKATCIATLLSLLCCACTPPRQNTRIDSDGGQYEYLLQGPSAGLTVVLEAGLGDDMNSFAELLPLLPSQLRVFAYNRAGLGRSRAPALAGDGLSRVGALHALLHDAGVAPPYVLVGHSLGGTLMELFARQHPNEVAGVVLIEARAAAFTRLCIQQRAAFCQPPRWMHLLLPQAARKELAAAAMTGAQIERAGAFPQVPLAVLTGLHKPIEGAAFRRVWLSTQKQLAGLSATSMHSLCEDCGHYLHRERPELILAAIQWVVERAGR